MKTIITSIIAFAFSSLALHAQGPSPVEQRLREQLKALTQRMGTAEAAQAALQAEKTEFEKKIKDYEKAVVDRAKEFDEYKAAAMKKEEQLASELAVKAKELEEKGALLVTATKLNDETRARLAKTEAELGTLKAQGIVLKRIVTDQRVKNAKMLETGQEILTRYEKFGLGTALTAREPFIGITRARLESMVDEYDGQLAAARIRLDGTSPKPASTRDRPTDGKPGRKTGDSKP